MTIDETIADLVAGQEIDQAMGDELIRRYRDNGIDTTRTAVSALLLESGTLLLDCTMERHVAVTTDISTHNRTDAVSIEFGESIEE
jgi:hypothetical protein